MNPFQKRHEEVEVPDLVKGDKGNTVSLLDLGEENIYYQYSQSDLYFDSRYPLGQKVDHETEDWLVVVLVGGDEDLKEVEYWEKAKQVVLVVVEEYEKSNLLSHLFLVFRHLRYLDRGFSLNLPQLFLVTRIDFQYQSGAWEDFLVVDVDEVEKKKPEVEARLLLLSSKR